ncbi:MAG: glycosyltransferase family 1 protein, partial [Chloroflexota bacterium]
MRIGIDVRYLSHGLVGGVHTYVANFVPALIELANDHEIFLYADTKRPFELRSLDGHVTVRYLPWRSPLSSL